MSRHACTHSGTASCPARGAYAGHPAQHQRPFPWQWWQLRWWHQTDFQDTPAGVQRSAKHTPLPCVRHQAPLYEHTLACPSSCANATRRSKPCLRKPKLRTTNSSEAPTLRVEHLAGLIWYIIRQSVLAAGLKSRNQVLTAQTKNCYDADPAAHCRKPQARGGMRTGLVVSCVGVTRSKPEQGLNPNVCLDCRLRLRKETPAGCRGQGGQRRWALVSRLYGQKIVQ